MRPGLSRGIPFGILGFVIGMVVLTVIRAVQGLQPLMDPQLGIIMGGFFSAGFFLYGMGASDPRMNQHAHEPAEGEEEHHAAEDEEDDSRPGEILGGYVWQLSTILLIVLGVIVVFAQLPDGPSLRTVHAADANVLAIGVVPLEIMGQTIHLSQLTLLIGFVVFMLLSLGVVAGGIGALFFTLNQGVARVKTVDQTTLNNQLASDVPQTQPAIMRWVIGVIVVAIGFGLVDKFIGTPITNEFVTLSFFLSTAGVFMLSFLGLAAFIRWVAGHTQWAWLVRAAIVLAGVGLVLGVLDFVIVWFGISGFSTIAALIFNIAVLVGLVVMRQYAAALYTVLVGILIPLFYFLLIGLIIAFDPPILFGISVGNALLIAAFIVRPKFMAHWIGYGARWTAQQLRRLPNGLQ